MCAGDVLFFSLSFFFSLWVLLLTLTCLEYEEQTGSDLQSSNSVTAGRDTSPRRRRCLEAHKASGGRASVTNALRLPLTCTQRCSVLRRFSRDVCVSCQLPVRQQQRLPHFVDPSVQADSRGAGSTLFRCHNGQPAGALVAWRLPLPRRQP